LETFTFKKVDSPELLQESFKLRFQVYCKECNFIKEEEYPQHFENDGFDEDSLHFVALDSIDTVVGAVRLILPRVTKFPIEDHCPHLEIDKNNFDRSKAAEVSRLVISKLLRRRSGDGLYYEQKIADKPSRDDQEGIFFRRIRPMAFGLYREMYHESKRRDIRYWFALMEKKLWLLLKLHGFIFKPIGEEVDFYGLVRPYLADLVEMENLVHGKFPKFFEYFMEGLELEFQPKFG